MNKEQEIPEQSPDRDWRFLYKHLRERFDVHDRSAIRRNLRYKKLAAIFHIAIPLLSIAVTIVAGSREPFSVHVAFGLGVVLTIMSTLNATLEPARRYREAVDRCIELHDLRVKMEASMEHLAQTHANPDEILKSLIDLNLELSEIGRKMAGIPIPREPRSVEVGRGTS